MTVFSAVLCGQMTAADRSLLAIAVLIVSGILIQVCVTFLVYLALNDPDDPSSPGEKAATLREENL